MLKKRRPFEDASVKSVFDAYPNLLRADLLKLREFIFVTARETEGIGTLVETLKWRQPAYLPAKPRIGTTIRIDALRGHPNRYAMFFHCQTTLVADFRELYGETFVYQGDRAVQFSQGADVPIDALKRCIAMALTYRGKARRKE